MKDSGDNLTSNEGSLRWFEMDELSETMPTVPFSAYYVVVSICFHLRPLA